MAKLTLNYPNIQDERGQLHSIADPSLYLTFGVWLYLVPQYKPKSVLMLGYGGGTAAKYIRLFYGDDVPITAVDFSDISEFLIDGVKWEQQDAKEWVHKTDQHFDAIIVDLYDTGDFHPPEFVLSKEFATRLGEIGDYIILHTTRDDNTDAYNYYKVRQLSTNSGGEFEPHFHYYVSDPVNRPVPLPVSRPQA